MVAVTATFVFKCLQLTVMVAATIMVAITVTVMVTFNVTIKHRDIYPYAVT